MSKTPGLDGFYYRNTYGVFLWYNDAMSLTKEEVEHIADLARLELTEEEKDRFGEQLSEILDYAARLQALDTSHIPPTSTVLATRSPLRPDVPAAGLTTEEVLRNAPRAEQDQFRVPPVMDLSA